MSKPTIKGKSLKNSLADLPVERKMTATYTEILQFVFYKLDIDGDGFISESDLVKFQNSKIKYFKTFSAIINRSKTLFKDFDLTGFEKRVNEKALDLPQFMQLFKLGIKLAKNFVTLYRSKSESTIVSKMRVLDELDYSFILLKLRDEQKQTTTYKLTAWNEHFTKENIKLDSVFEGLFLKEQAEIKIGKYTIQLAYDSPNMSENYVKKIEDTRAILEHLNHKYESTRKEMMNYLSIVQGIESNANEINYHNFIYFMNKLFLSNLEDEHDSSQILNSSNIHDRSFNAAHNLSVNDRSYMSSSKSVFKNRILSKLDVNSTSRVTTLNNPAKDRILNSSILSNDGNPEEKPKLPLVNDKIKQILSSYSSTFNSETADTKKKPSLQNLLKFAMKAKGVFSEYDINCAKEYFKLTGNKVGGKRYTFGDLEM